MTGVPTADRGDEGVNITPKEEAVPEATEGSTTTPKSSEPVDTPIHEASDANPKSVEPENSGTGKAEDEAEREESSMPALLTAQCQGLAEEVVEFCRKLGPLKTMMTTNLQSRMLRMNALAEKIKEELEDDDDSASTSSSESIYSSLTTSSFGSGRRPPPARPMDIRVERLTMEDWRSKTSIHNWGPCIQAHYRRLNVPILKTSLPKDSKSARLHQVQPDLPSDSKNLQRIVIKSPVIRLELERIISVPLAMPIAITPPFKVILQCLPQLRQQLQDLQAELEDLESTTKCLPDSEPGDSSREPDMPKEIAADDGEQGSEEQDERMKTPAKPKKEAEAPKREDADSPTLSLQNRISHLKLLVDFADDELHETLRLRSEITAGTLKEILFEDLWHLFQPGDLILSSCGPNQQLFKVCAVTGGQVQLRNHTREESEHMNRLRERAVIGPPRSVGQTQLHDLQREEASGLGVWTPFTIDCFAMAFDGNQVGPLDFCIRISHYSGKKSITDLDVYPLRFHPNSEELLQKMEKRGRKVLTSYGHKRYKGATLTQSGSDILEDINSDVFIDTKTFRSLRPQHPAPPGVMPPPPSQWMPMQMKLGQLLKTKQNPTETSETLGSNHLRLCGHEIDTKLSEDFMAANRLDLNPAKASDVANSSYHLQLLHYPVMGYAFRYRKWCCLDIDRIEDIDHEREARESGFNELVIPKRYRELLVALVDSHISDGQSQPRHEGALEPGSGENRIDLVKGKGQGVIILLHGPPGSGKTSTAETIAAYTQRPLYSITCGDIGITPVEAERNLTEHTRRADKWGCVLLLDEADVFLMQRDWQRMDRNALVSIFLRELEYYSGILFLTTNRPGVLDEAFKSRIHITLRYPGVDLESTKAMWTNIIRRLERDNENNETKVIFNQDELLEFAERHYRRHEREGSTWNGRQIRNAFRTALALGRHERNRMLRDEGITPTEAAKSSKKKWKRVKLTKTNFQKIAKTAHEFEEYLVALRGRDTDNVRDAEVRDDVFDIMALGEAVQRARKDYGSAAKGKKTASAGASGAQGKGTSSRPSGGRKKRGVVVNNDSDDEDEVDDDNEEGDEEDDVEHSDED